MVFFDQGSKGKKMIRAPKFWYDNSKASSRVLAFILSPLSWVFDAVVQLRFKTNTQLKTSVPIICIGNLVVGGAGKTPTVAAIADFLVDELGMRGYILSHGYKGLVTGPLKVDTTKHTSQEVGDEALLLAEHAPTWVSKDRRNGIVDMTKSGANIIIMDDGHQNPHLQKRVSLIVVDGGAGFGNGKVFPGGPLRETEQNGLKRADCVVIIGEDKVNVTEEIHTIDPKIPVFMASIVPTGTEHIKDQKIVGFAGIGRPEKFLHTLEDAGAEVLKFFDFPDHHPYKESDIAPIMKHAEELGGKVFTTEKDYVRLPLVYKDRIEVVPIMLQWKNVEELTTFMKSKLRPSSV